MTLSKPRLAFISPQFLFPNDAGGKIRTTNILRGMKSSAFSVLLASPATAEDETRYAADIAAVCDDFIAWRPTAPRPVWLRAFDLLDALPVNVVSDRTAPGLAALRSLGARNDIDLFVFDFVHAAVLRPAGLDCATVCFTHNVEAEIFARHATQARDFANRWMWRSQHEKMRRFEKRALGEFTSVVAVSERDAFFFSDEYGIRNACAIPTGVDLDFFSYQEPPEVGPDTPPTVVFTGSMNWIANIDGVRFFLEHVWSRVVAERPEARFLVVGRDPPESLFAAARRQRNVELTGFVDDVRPYAHAAHAFVIPLLVGGGTRIKAFEAMAMGCPVVSTSIGMEGLEVTPDEHYLCRDDPASMASALIMLLDDPKHRLQLSRRARDCVEQRFGHAVAARAFEGICVGALKSHADCHSDRHLTAPITR